MGAAGGSGLGSRVRGALVRAPLACLTIGLSLGLADAEAQDLEPRQYANLPRSVNFIGAAFFDSEGSVLFDPSVELENADLGIDGWLAVYARSIGLAGMSAKVDGGIGRLCLSGTAEYQGQPVSRSVCGVSDAKMRLSVNFLGAPSLRIEEFGGYAQDLIAGASLQLSAPTGQYDPERLVNIGTNRWSLKAEAGMSKTIERWFFEVALAGTWYQTNDEFFGGQTRQQDPLYSFQIHAVRTFRGGVWFALDWTNYRGGETTTNGVGNGNLQSNGRFGLTLSLPVARYQTIRLNASSGVFTRTGSDFDTAGVSWTYRWGGGL